MVYGLKLPLELVFYFIYSSSLQKVMLLFIYQQFQRNNFELTFYSQAGFYHLIF